MVTQPTGGRNCWTSSVSTCSLDSQQGRHMPHSVHAHAYVPHACIRTHACLHSFTCIHTCTFMRKQTCTDMRACKHAHTYARARTHTHTHTHTRPQVLTLTSFGAARDRRRVRMTTASTPDADADAARVVRVHTSHSRSLPFWSTYFMLWSLSHRVLAMSSRPVTRAAKSLSPWQPAPATAAALPAATATPRTLRRSPARAAIAPKPCNPPRSPLTCRS